MKISIIGAGYVGLVTGACLAFRGHRITCVDKKPEVVKAINTMRSPLHEPGLEDILRQAGQRGYLQAQTEIKSAVIDADVVIIAVGTPSCDQGIDLSHVLDCAREIGTALKEKQDYCVVAVKSTVVPTTTGTAVRAALEAGSGRKAGEFGLAMNPEFLREGNAVEDFMYPDRIVIGGFDQQSFSVMEKVYAGFDAPIVRVDLATAEMIKYASNALLAVLISYSNEIASICEAAGKIDVRDVLEAVTLDKRFNPRVQGELVNPGLISYLRAGCGFGGSCFPKDLSALAAFSRGRGYEPRILEAVLRINHDQPHKVTSALQRRLGSLDGRKIAVLGLSFKPGTDDVRETPSLPIITDFLAAKAEVVGVDPYACDNMSRIISPQENLTFTRDWKAALQGAEAAVLVTPWPEYMEISGETFRSLMKNVLIMDCRRVLNREPLEALGCQYLGIGLNIDEGLGDHG